MGDTGVTQQPSSIMSTDEKKEKKEKKKLGLQAPENVTQSSSTGAVRWALPEEPRQMHNSAPTKITPRKPKDLKDLRGLQECTKFIINWKQQVENVCKNSTGADGSSKDQKDLPSSLERSRKLILRWAEELKKVDALFSDVSERKEEKQNDKATTQSDNTEADQRVMEWAKELQTVTERCGLMREELLQALRQLQLRKKKLMMTLLPFLEFITWSMLKEDRDSVSQLWLATKQRTWKTETPKYIPNSVWDWICSASVNVTLDTMTNHPWLIVSDDRKKVQEAHTEIEVAFSAQRFDSWPCVLGWEGMAVGRHYWEVQLANNGYWRLGLTTASSKRQGRFTMCPEEGYWTLWRSTRQFYACSKPETLLPQELVPTRVGIYLDYDEGQISFYNAETRSHLYTFKGVFREKLYPLFAPLDGRTLMTITSPNM
ncbi:E3 ubiquitin-protein ligase TRIM39 [Sardina pilchardus]|uniref:E3 ubiquitin-protein ligase TRIM39 n=1 Tax=Sardina pilchardus TaxID=27697 RepID=UPI002E119E36